MQTVNFIQLKAHSHQAKVESEVSLIFFAFASTFARREEILKFKGNRYSASNQSIFYKCRLFILF